MLPYFFIQLNVTDRQTTDRRTTGRAISATVSAVG